MCHQLAGICLNRTNLAPLQASQNPALGGRYVAVQQACLRGGSQVVVLWDHGSSSEWSVPV